MKDDANSPQVLTKVLTEAEATLLVGHLESLGIKAVVSGAGTSTGWPEAPSDVQVVVRRNDFARAREALDLIRDKRSKPRSDDVGDC